MYDRRSKRWVNRSTSNDTKPLPVRLELHSKSIAELDSKKNLDAYSVRRWTADSTPDTGATVVCHGPELMDKMKIGKSQLMKADIKLYAANRRRLDVLGCLPFHITHVESEQSTLEMVYVVKELRGLYLSKNCLVALGCIPPSFPLPAASATLTAKHTDSVCAMEDCNDAQKAETAPCGCPKRTDTPDPPEPPCELTEENIPRLKAFIMAHYASSTFNTCCHQSLPFMHGPPLEIQLKPDAKPSACYTPAVIPIHMEKAVKEALDRDESMGVIQKVPPNVHTHWVARMVIQRKHNGDPRRTVDYQALNDCTLRQTHPTSPPYRQASSVPRNWWYTSADAFNGYHSTLLKQECRPLTTFITPWGRYWYNSTMQGSNIAGDAFTHRFDMITSELTDYKRQIDDSLLYKPTVADMYQHTVEFLSLVGKNGILQNPDKFVFCEKSIDWAGYRIGPDTLKPLLKHTEAIRCFPTPKNLTDLRSFMALVNQVSVFYASQPKLVPFRDLLKKNAKWYWDEQLEHLFQETKERIASEIERGIELFDPIRPTALLTDWCRSGMGYVLMQKHCQCHDITPLCCTTGVCVE